MFNKHEWKIAIQHAYYISKLHCIYKLNEFFLFLDNAVANVTLFGELVKRNGVEYLHYKKMAIKIKVGSGRLQLDNLFGGEPVLGMNNCATWCMYVYIYHLLLTCEKF